MSEQQWASPKIFDASVFSREEPIVVVGTPLLDSTGLIILSATIGTALLTKEQDEAVRWIIAAGVGLATNKIPAQLQPVVLDMLNRGYLYALSLGDGLYRQDLVPVRNSFYAGVKEVPIAKAKQRGRYVLQAAAGRNSESTSLGPDNFSISWSAIDDNKTMQQVSNSYYYPADGKLPWLTVKLAERMKKTYDEFVPSVVVGFYYSIILMVQAGFFTLDIR